MANGEKRTVTIKQIKGEPWNKPDSNQYWYTVVIAEYQSEPIKFIQDRDKGVPPPEEGKKYTGNVYTGDKGLKFYPFPPKREFGKRDDASIKAQMAIKASVHLWSMNPDWNLEQVEVTAKNIYEMVDRIKGTEPESAKGATEKPEDEVYSVKEDEPINLNDIPF